MSQGQAVEAQANRLKVAQQLTRRTGAEHKVVGDTIYRRYKRPILKDYWSPVTTKGNPDYEAAVRDAGLRKAVAAAPVLKTLDQTTRISHAIAAGSNAALKGQSVPKAVVRGAELKDRTNFGDVLRTAGVHNRAVSSAAGFALDVATDPTTYLTGGVGKVGEKAAVDAAAKAAAKAAKAGMSESGAATVARAAAKRAAAKAPDGSGVAVKFAGHEVPGVRRATAAAARTAKKPVRKVAPTASRTASTNTRKLAREFAPRVRPADVTEEQFQAARAAARSARATTNTAEQRAVTLAQHLQRTLPREHYAAVIDAVERNDLSRLPSKELARHAHQLRSALKGVRRSSRRAGVAAGHQVGDVSRFLSAADEKRLAKSVAAEQRAQKRAISRASTREQGARERALVTEAVGSATGKRAGQAAIRYMNRAADTHLSTQKLKAAQNIPVRSAGESHEAWLRRIVKHAKAHDLPLVRQRAEKLLAKMPQDVAKGYFPRDFDARVLKKLGLTTEEAATRTVRTGTGPSRKVAQTTAGFARNEQRRLAVVNPERQAAGKVPHSEDIPLVVLNHMREAARATSQGEFAKAMAKTGRKVSSADELMPGEQIYKLGYQGRQFGLHAVKDVPRKPTRGGQYVALNRHLLEAMQGQTRQAQAGSMAGHIFDKATGGFKRVATATIGFHVRNVLGDLQQHYLATPGYRIPANVAAASKAVKRASEQARSTMPTATEATVRVGGKHQPIDEFLKGARENGVLDTGYIGREIHDLGQHAVDQARKVRGGRARRAGQTVDRWMTNRENLMRLATYKAGLDQGMTPARAADLANHIHVDYGELSDVERKVMRRVFPFYTWTARSLPVHATALVTKPGKFATIEKAREETAGAFGMNEDANRRGSNENIQRQLPFVVKIGHGALGVSFSLPATLLNELPTGASPQALNAWLSEVGRFMVQMVNPIIKAPTEAYLGVSTYTKRPIEDPHKPLTAAPAWVQFLPPWAKRELEVTPNFIEKRTGKKTWGWRGRADWVSRQVPGAPQQVSTIASGGRPGQPKDVGTAVLGAAGIRVDALNAQAVKRTKEVQVFKQLAKLNQRAAALNQQGVNKDHPTAEYTHLRAQINALTHQVRPPKGRKHKAAGPLPLGGGTTRKLSLGGGGSGAKLPLG